MSRPPGLKEKTIHDLIRSVRIRHSTYLYIAVSLLLPLTVMAGYYFEKDKTDAVISAVNQQLVNAISTGDKFQIEAIKGSIVTSTQARTLEIMDSHHRPVGAYDVNTSEAVDSSWQYVSARSDYVIRNRDLGTVGYVRVERLLSLFKLLLYVAALLTPFIVADYLTGSLWNGFASKLRERISLIPDRVSNGNYSSVGLREIDVALKRLASLKTFEDEAKQLALDIKIQEERVLLAKRVAHDIRSPLSAIKIIGEVATGLTSDQLSMLRMAGDRIGRIASSLLTDHITGVEAHTNLTFKEMISDTLREKALIVPDKKQVTIESNHIGLENFQFPYSLLDLQRVLSNLIDNAIEAIPRNGQVRVNVESDKEFISISVSDTGEGVSADILPLLGTLGFSTRNQNSELRTSGCGLGLHAARRFAENLGGHLTFKSKLGKGTSVRLMIPAG